MSSQEEADKEMASRLYQAINQLIEIRIVDRDPNCSVSNGARLAAGSNLYDALRAMVSR